jgi:hypothetical protein
VVLNGGVFMLQLETFVVFAVQKVCFSFVQKLLIDVLCLWVLGKLEINRSQTLACFQRQVFVGHPIVLFVKFDSFVPLCTRLSIGLGHRVYQSSSKAVSCSSGIFMVDAVV